MASKKPVLIEVASRTISARLDYQRRPRFHDTTATVGDRAGFSVEVQFDSGYLHGLVGPYWLRFELRRPDRVHSVVQYPDGAIHMVRGGAGITRHYTSHFEFNTDAEMERVLDQVGIFIATWEPEAEAVNHGC